MTTWRSVIRDTKTKELKRGQEFDTGLEAMKLAFSLSYEFPYERLYVEQLVLLRNEEIFWEEELTNEKMANKTNRR